MVKDLYIAGCDRGPLTSGYCEGTWYEILLLFTAGVANDRIDDWPIVTMPYGLFEQICV
jgi:hypothetical protein